MKIQEVPAEAPFRTVLFADGAKGMAMQQYRCDLYQVSVVATRESRDEPFVQAITHDELEGSYSSLAELNAAIRAHNEAQDEPPEK